MTSVKVKFRESTIPKREGVIYIQLIHDRKVKLITTRFRLFKNEWDGKSECVKPDGANPTRWNDLQLIKNGIDGELKILNGLINILNKRSYYTVDDIAEYYVNNTLTGSLLSFMEYRIKKMYENNQFKTASIYSTVLNSFRKFRLDGDLQIDKIDRDLMMRYELYLKSDGICQNTISCYMRVLRAIYNRAVEAGLTIQRYPFKRVYTGIDKTIKRAVSESVIIRLKDLDLSDKADLSMARDLFLFSFYSRGMSFVDMANLRRSNANNGNLSYKRSKTGQNLVIRIEPCMDEIINRYKHLAVEDYLLPIFTSTKSNYMGQLRNYNNRLRRISQLLDLPKSLSSYVSRHSWATLALRKGISVQIISEGMGHENESTTRIYLASLDQAIIDDANARIIAL